MEDKNKPKMPKLPDKVPAPRTSHDLHVQLPTLDEMRKKLQQTEENPNLAEQRMALCYSNL